MDMKPDYNFGNKSDIAIRLLEHKAGENPLRVKYILRQIELGKIEIKSHKHWHSEYDYYDGKVLLRYYLSDETEAKMLKEKMEWAGAEVDVCYRTFYFAFAPDAFSNIVDWRTKYDYIGRFSSGAFCEEMTCMNEYSLLKWAEANGIQEAYRLCIFPSFTPPQIIRVWLKNGTGYVVHKEYVPSFCPEKPKIINAKSISIEQWHSLESYMAKKFWSARSWYSVPENYGVNNGTYYLFEGWHNGQYKVLDDHSPDDGVSWYTIELFESVAK